MTAHATSATASSQRHHRAPLPAAGAIPGDRGAAPPLRPAHEHPDDHDRLVAALVLVTSRARPPSDRGSTALSHRPSANRSRTGRDDEWVDRNSCMRGFVGRKSGEGRALSRRENCICIRVRARKRWKSRGACDAWSYTLPVLPIVSDSSATACSGSRRVPNASCARGHGWWHAQDARRESWPSLQHPSARSAARATSQESNTYSSVNRPSGSTR